MWRANSIDSLVSELIETTAKLIGTIVSVDASLVSAGLDSISATELSTSLSDSLDTELPSTLIFDHPSLQSIASSLVNDCK